MKALYCLGNVRRCAASTLFFNTCIFLDGGIACVMEYVVYALKRMLLKKYSWGRFLNVDVFLKLKKD